MLYRATVSFSGVISMAEGEVRELTDSALIDDLTKAGHIFPYEADKKPVKEEKPKAKKTTKRKEKTKDED